MSEDSMQNICSAMHSEYNLLVRYCEITKHGSIDELSAAITDALGHCDRTANERIKFLIASKVIIPFGKQWKFNEKGNIDHKNRVNLIKSLRESGEIITKEEDPKDAFEKDLDKANKERHHIDGD